MYNMSMKNFDPQTMTRATPADIFRIWRELYGVDKMPQTLVSIRTVSDVDGQPYQVADVIENGATLPHSIPLYEYLDEAWELKADVVHEYLDFAELVNDEVSHPVTDMQDTEQAIDAQLAVLNPPKLDTYTTLPTTKYGAVTMQKISDEHDRQFNQHYYGNEEGKFK